VARAGRGAGPRGRGDPGRGRAGGCATSAAR
jgi:hypothetical protein